MPEPTDDAIERDLASLGAARRGGKRLNSDEAIQQEILAEKAATLGRAGQRLEMALAEVAELRRAHAAASGEARARVAADYEVARKKALDARRVLIIQREAIGLRNHRLVDQTYPEPPPLR
jgi:hypothetical protein